MQKPPRSRVRTFLMLAAVCAALLGLCQIVSPALRVNAEPDVSGTRDFPIRNPIDKFVLARLQQEKVDASPTCSDEEFVRRVYLDVAGCVPPREAVKAFLSDRGSDKRARLIDALLETDRYADHFSTMWGDLLREHTNSRPREGTERGSYREWIREALEKNMPYDQFVRELITSSGSADENGAVNFYLRDEQDRVETTNTVATAFMGTRMSCAQCHDHPFDKWTQNDFHSIMAFFGRTSVAPDPVATLLKIEKDQRLPGELRIFLKPYFDDAHEAREKEQKVQDLGATNDPKNKMAMNMQMMGMMVKGRELQKEIEKNLSKDMAQRARQILQNSQVRQVVEGGNAEYRMPADTDDPKKKRKSGEIIQPEFPWEPSKKIEAGSQRRKALADALVSNRQFAAVQANRLWARLMGRGIVDPIDDFREKNPPSHPELLDYLTDEFIKAKFDNKHVLRLILNSSTYQRSSKPTATNKSDTTLYSHTRLRRLSAEQLLDSVLIATGRESGLSDLSLEKDAYRGGGKKKAGKRREAGSGDVQWAVDLPTPARQGTFLHSFNQPSREQIVPAREETGAITQALELLNGKALNDAVRSSPTIAELLQSKATAPQAVTELYLSALSRYPTAEEVRYTTSVLKGAAPTREWMEDVCWALLNAREFAFNK
ncbi:MAG TPA: DUF1549 and DUF1553 domain-containing protein [Planctomycetota bacterium]|nr:DUF1549 and DUF1553 domain-containing protein [Planctomycetota bacterium]